MALESELLNQLIATFKTELDEKLQIITDGLVTLEKSSKRKGNNEKVIEEIFRAAHNIKGSARGIGITYVGEIAHQIESLFSSIREKKTAITPSTISLCFLAVDAMHSAMNSFCNNEPLNFDVEELLRQMQSNKPIKENTLPKIAKAELRDEQNNGKTNEYESIRVPLQQIENIATLVEQMQTNKIAIEEHYFQLRAFIAKMKQLNRHTFDSSEQLTELNRLIQRLGTSMHSKVNDLSITCNSLQEEARMLRLVPASNLLRPLTRIVRDLAHELNKKIDFEILGDNVKMDKMILEGIKDPLIHLLRNAVDHGIENSETRIKNGKPEYGKIIIEVLDEGNQISIKIKDDGTGIDYQQIAQVAEKRNLVTHSELEHMDKASILELIFQPAFSTKDIITNISGRGVGLDVVKSNLIDIKGDVTFTTELGKGTIFHLRLPLTLSSDRGLTIKSSGQLFIIPISTVERVLMMHSSDIREVETNQIILFEHKPIPLKSLSTILNLEQQELHLRDKLPILVLKKGFNRIALLVEEILSECEIVVKPLNAPLGNVPCVAGGTLSGSGDIIIVLNPGDIMNQALYSGKSSRITMQSDKSLASRPHILLVDDSITTRTLEKNILESSDYNVTVAVDGKEAWDLLQKQTFSLVITDVEMPNMTGFELTEHIKTSEKLQNIPVIIITSLESEEQKKRGIEVGANAYIVKHEFESVGLIETVGQLV